MSLLANRNSKDLEKRKSGHSNQRQTLSIKYQKILETIEKASFSITPLKISSLTGIKHSTVRKYVKELEKRGFIWRPHYGHYFSRNNLFTLGRCMGKSDSARLHCLKLRISNSFGSVKSWTKIFSFVKVTFQQYKNGTVTVFVDCNDTYSLDYVAFCMLVELIKNELNLENLEKVTVSSFEFNNDVEGLKLDGAKAVTFGAFDGSFRRVYQKRFGIRDEVKAIGSIAVENVMTLLNGSVDSYNISQLLFELLNELKLERKAMKFQNGLVIDAVSKFGRYVEALRARTEIVKTSVKTNMQTQTETTKVIHHEQTEKKP